MTTPGTTRVAVLTADGRGAVAVVRVWGARAVEVADAAFRPARPPRLAESPRGRLRLGRMGAGLGDEVVAVVLDGDPPAVEVHCHGGPAPRALVIEALRAAGAAPAGPESWAEDAAPDRLSAAAWIDLARAPTARTAEVLLEQAEGALAAEVRRLAARAEVDPAAALADLDALLRRAAVGRRLITGWRVALAGRPNVGKSCLLNALAGYDRAIVDPTPGTTRDVVTARTACDGWPVELADTAGLRDATDPLEAAGVALARARQAAADLVLLVLDRSEPLTAADRDLLAAHPAALVVANKADLPAAWPADRPDILAVSAQRGDGLDGLLAAIAARLVPEPPPPGAAVPFREDQALALRQAREQLAAGEPAPAIAALSRALAP